MQDCRLSLVHREKRHASLRLPCRTADCHQYTVRKGMQAVRPAYLRLAGRPAHAQRELRRAALPAQVGRERGDEHHAAVLHAHLHLQLLTEPPLLRALAAAALCSQRGSRVCRGCCHRSHI